MSEKLNSHATRGKYSTTSDTYWMRYDIENDLLKDGNWIVLMSLKQKYHTGLNMVSNSMYYLEYFYKSRYIEMGYKKYPTLRRETENESMKEIIKWIENEVYKEKDKDPNEKSQTPTYDVFKRDQKRKLSSMLDALIGQKNAIMILQEDEGRFLFGVIEFRFFSYLIDTYCLLIPRHFSLCVVVFL